MTYRNFDSKANLSMLSPQEKAEFYRDRAAMNLAKKAVSTGYGAIGGALGAAAMIYGGPQATLMGGVGGAMLGKTAATKVTSTVEDAVDYNKSMKDNQKVKEYFGKDPAKRGDKIFTSGGSKKATWQRPPEKPVQKKETNQQGVSNNETSNNEKPVIEKASGGVPEIIKKYSNEGKTSSVAEDASKNVERV